MLIEERNITNYAQEIIRIKSYPDSKRTRKQTNIMNSPKGPEDERSFPH